MVHGQRFRRQCVAAIGVECFRCALPRGEFNEIMDSEALDYVTRFGQVHPIKVRVFVFFDGSNLFQMCSNLWRKLCLESTEVATSPLAGDPTRHVDGYRRNHGRHEKHSSRRAGQVCRRRDHQFAQEGATREKGKTHPRYPSSARVQADHRALFSSGRECGLLSKHAGPELFETKGFFISPVMSATGFVLSFYQVLTMSNLIRCQRIERDIKPLVVVA